jgi:hypothetical protein
VIERPTVILQQPNTNSCQHHSASISLPPSLRIQHEPQPNEKNVNRGQNDSETVHELNQIAIIPSRCNEDNTFMNEYEIYLNGGENLDNSEEDLEMEEAENFTANTLQVRFFSYPSQSSK